MDTTTLLIAGVGVVLLVIYVALRNRIWGEIDVPSLPRVTVDSDPKALRSKVRNETRDRCNIPLSQRRRVNSRGMVAPSGYCWNEEDELFYLEGLIVLGIVHHDLWPDMQTIPLAEIAAINEQYLVMLFGYVVLSPDTDYCVYDGSDYCGYDDYEHSDQIDA